MNIKFKNGFLVALWGVLLFPVMLLALDNIGTVAYNGQYFRVEYPQNFIPKPTPSLFDINATANSLPDSTNLLPEYEPRARTDEAYFTSPDGLVEFFIHSPLWAGWSQPKEYLIVKANEKLVSQENKKSNKSAIVRGKDQVMIKWVTIKAKNGDYFRSYKSEKACGLYKNELIDCESHIFGIKYKNKKAYDKYRNDYIKFKKSLEQYADA